MNRTPTTSLPLDKTFAPTSEDDVRQIVRDALGVTVSGTVTPIYPLGGKTSLDYGLPAKQKGWGVDLSSLTQVIDYPARDMTITLEAGVTMAQLSETLAKENQRLPVDVPQAAQATVGGVLATNFNGPRRLGCGLLRDHVIGIAAVDGHGKLFHGGGRVVKNVAGYDFCKLLTGSLGTLGIITQVTFKLQPIPECSAIVACAPRTLAAAEEVLAALVHSKTRPVAVELVAGAAWKNDQSLAPLAGGRGLAQAIFVLLEGTAREVAWMTTQLQDEWKQAAISDSIVLDNPAPLMAKTIEFPAENSAPLVLKASVRPSSVVSLVETAQQIDSQVSIVAHAQSGVVLLRYDSFPSEGISRAVVGKLQSEVATGGGSLVVLSNPSQSEMTPRSVFGVPHDVLTISTAIKRQFDPRDILNRGRFIFRSET